MILFSTVVCWTPECKSPHCPLLAKHGKWSDGYNVWLVWNSNGNENIFWNIWDSLTLWDTVKLQLALNSLRLFNWHRILDVMRCLDVFSHFGLLHLEWWSCSCTTAWRFVLGVVHSQQAVCWSVCVLSSGGLTEVMFVMWQLSAGGHAGERWSERTEPIVCKVTLCPKPTVSDWGFTAGSKSLEKRFSYLTYKELTN